SRSAPAENIAVTSTITSTAADENTHTSPPGATAVIVLFGRASPAPKFTVEATGGCVPHGYTVRKPASSAPTAVTFNATAAASALPVATVSTPSRASRAEPPRPE